LDVFYPIVFSVESFNNIRVPKGGFFTFTLARAMFSLIGEIKPFILATIITLAFGF